MFCRESSKLAQHACCPSKFLARMSPSSAKHCQSWRDRAQSALAPLLFLAHERCFPCAQSPFPQNKNDLSILLKSFSHKGGYIKIRRTDGRYKISSLHLPSRVQTEIPVWYNLRDCPGRCRNNHLCMPRCCWCNMRLP